METACSHEGPAAPAVSVVIAARNAAATIGEQLAALASQDGAAPFEVVVVDNGSDDATRAVAESFRGSLDVRVIDASEAIGRAHARNKGVEVARAPLLLFVDADDMVHSGYVAAMATALRSNPAVAARIDLTRFNPSSGSTGLSTSGLSGGMMGWLPLGGGGTLGITRELFESVGGFDTAFSRAEDADLCYRVQLNGATLAYVPDAVISCRMRSSSTSSFRQAREDALCITLLYKRYRQHGMPRHNARSVIRLWLGTARMCLRIRSRHDLLGCARLLGLRLGFVEGSLRNGVLYL